MENLSATNEILSMISPEGERVAFGKASICILYLADFLITLCIRIGCEGTS